MAFVIPAEAPPGSYLVFIALTPAGALAREPVDPGQVLVATATFSIQP